MLVAMYYNNNDVRVQEIPKPNIGDEEFLLKVMASGICGSDVTEWYRVPKAPRVLGHEATGIIEELGRNVKNYDVGDRVFVSHHVPCGKCRNCLLGHQTACEMLHNTNYYPGGFSQFIRVPKINVEKGVYKLPDSLSFEEGTFIEPLACVIRGQKLSKLAKNDSLLIIGGGLSGLLHVKLAKAKGVKKIIVSDINEFRLQRAKEFGANHAIDANHDVPKQIKELNGGQLADQVIVCTGATQAAQTALKSIGKGGTILFFAVPDPTVKISVPITEFWRNEITIKTSYGAAPPELEESLNLIKTKTLTVNNMITHRLSIQEAAEGFRIVAAAGSSLKVILEPNRS